MLLANIMAVMIHGVLLKRIPPSTPIKICLMGNPSMKNNFENTGMSISVLTSLFGEHSTDTVIEKLIPVANTQSNESFSGVVGYKNLKFRHYGVSGSNDFQVSCCVSPKI